MDDFQVIYDALPALEEDAGSVVYDPKPIAERDEPWRAAGLEEMFVDEDHRIPINKLRPKTLDFWGKLIHGFAHKRGEYVTYQEVQAWAKEVGIVRANFTGPSMSYLVRWMNCLWKAGLIRKYRRGLYMSHARLHDGKGESHGITYWFWGNG